MIGLITTLIAYLLGSIPFGYFIVRWQKGIDVRTTGSGGTGAANVMRNLGIAGFVATLVLDFAKGCAAVGFAARLTHNDPRWVAAAGVVAIAGHIFPLWLRFRGGKGVATAVGVFVWLAPVPVGICLVVFAVLVTLWRYVSLSSILTAAAFPAVVYFVNHPPLPIVLGAAAAAVLVIGRQHANIRRLLSGTENRLGSQKIAGSRL